MILDGVSITEAVSVSLYLEAGNKFISPGYTSSMCSTLFLASHSRVRLPAPVPLGALLTSSTGAFVAERPGVRFSKLFSGAATKLGGALTDGFENSNMHCVLGTDGHSNWLVKGAFAFCRAGASHSSIFMLHRQGTLASPNLHKDCFHSIRILSSEYRVPVVQMTSQGRIQPGFFIPPYLLSHDLSM